MSDAWANAVVKVVQDWVAERPELRDLVDCLNCSAVEGAVRFPLRDMIPIPASVDGEGQGEWGDWGGYHGMPLTRVRAAVTAKGMMRGPRQVMKKWGICFATKWFAKSYAPPGVLGRNARIRVQCLVELRVRRRNLIAQLAGKQQYLAKEHWVEMAALLFVPWKGSEPRQSQFYSGLDSDIPELPVFNVRKDHPLFQTWDAPSAAFAAEMSAGNPAMHQAMV